MSVAIPTDRPTVSFLDTHAPCALASVNVLVKARFAFGVQVVVLFRVRQIRFAAPGTLFVIEFGFFGALALKMLESKSLCSQSPLPFLSLQFDFMKTCISVLQIGHVTNSSVAERLIPAQKVTGLTFRHFRPLWCLAVSFHPPIDQTMHSRK